MKKAQEIIYYWATPPRCRYSDAHGLVGKIGAHGLVGEIDATTSTSKGLGNHLL
jgi:hypothetical protein